MTEALPLWIEVPASLLLVFAGAFALVGTIGLVRLRDFAMRLHGPTKVSTLGIGLLLIASIIIMPFGGGRLGVHELMITLFLFMTAPIAAHLLIRAALRTQPDLRPPEADDPATGAPGDAPGGGEAGDDQGGAGGDPDARSRNARM
jgi:multicomponent K+:H+ antiporter subunit G